MRQLKRRATRHESPFSDLLAEPPTLAASYVTVYGPNDPFSNALSPNSNHGHTPLQGNTSAGDWRIYRGTRPSTVRSGTLFEGEHEPGRRCGSRGGRYPFVHKGQHRRRDVRPAARSRWRGNEVDPRRLRG